MQFFISFCPACYAGSCPPAADAIWPFIVCLPLCPQALLFVHLHHVCQYYVPLRGRAFQVPSCNVHSSLSSWDLWVKAKSLLCATSLPEFFTSVSHHYFLVAMNGSNFASYLTYCLVVSCKSAHPVILYEVIY